MQKVPVKTTDTKVRGLWRNRLRSGTVPTGELQQDRARVQQLLLMAQQKTLQISEALKSKAAAQTKLQRQLADAFKKTAGSGHQKALARARMELENHLHHAMNELDTRKTELREIYREVRCIKDLVRKA